MTTNEAIEKAMKEGIDYFKEKLDEKTFEQYPSTIKIALTKALTSLANEKDKEIEMLQLLNKQLSDTIEKQDNELGQTKSLYENVRTQCDNFRKKCQSQKDDEIEIFAEEFIKFLNSNKNKKELEEKIKPYIQRAISEATQELKSGVKNAWDKFKVSHKTHSEFRPCISCFEDFEKELNL